MAIGVMLRLVCGRFAGVETWYSRTAGTVDPDGLNAGRALAEARAECLASNAYVEGYRVFDSTVKYSVRNVSLSDPVNNGALGIVGQLPAGASNRADIQGTSLMAKAFGIAGGRNRQSSRELFAVPDNVVQTSANGNRVYAPTAAFKDGLAAYRAEILRNWNFRCLTISTRYNNLGFLINASPPGLLGVQASIGADPLIVPGKPVRIRNARKSGTVLTLNGRWIVDSIVAPTAPSTVYTVYLVGSQGYDPNAYDPRGTIEGIDFLFCSPSEYMVVRPMSRKRGGRSGLPLGRLKARGR